MKRLVRLRQHWRCMYYRLVVRAWVCRILGHRNVITIPHMEICEEYWTGRHEDLPDDRLCRFCEEFLD